MQPILPHYTVTSEPSSSRADSLVAALRKYNYEKRNPLWDNPPHQPEPIQFYVVDQDETLIGGLMGRTHQIPEWLEITILWVAEEWRQQGLGRRLMQLAEDEARRRECIYARLATGDYQAPDFYRKLGYREYGRLENLPRGETGYYFYKELI